MPTQRSLDVITIGRGSLRRPGGRLEDMGAFRSYEDIVDACCDAWNTFLVEEETVRSITTRQWATCQNL